MVIVTQTGVHQMVLLLLLCFMILIDLNDFILIGMNAENLNVQDYQLLIDRGWRRLEN